MNEWEVCSVSREQVDAPLTALSQESQFMQRIWQLRKAYIMSSPRKWPTRVFVTNETYQHIIREIVQHTPPDRHATVGRLFPGKEHQLKVYDLMVYRSDELGYDEIFVA